jgi:hypothetical protein
MLILVMALTAAPASWARDLNDPELVYTHISRAFPGTVEDAGGLSSEIALVELLCYFSNIRKNGRVPKRIEIIHEELELALTIRPRAHCLFEIGRRAVRRYPMQPAADERQVREIVFGPAECDQLPE